MEKIPISKNLYRGELITNPMDIKRLALEKKSVYFLDGSWRIRPAAWLINLPFFIIARLIENKGIYYTHK